MRRTILIAAMFGIALLSQAAAPASPPPGSPEPAMKREIIPGSQLMTSSERERYRQRMKQAQSPDERAQVRSEHVRQMQERARLRGLRLADPYAERSPR